MTNPPPFAEDSLANASREEIMSALFANMVIQQTNMAMMMLGKVAHPETGQFFQDLEGAKMFIDQLEMIEAKTKGNLSRQEDGLLKQGLAALRMAFVESLENQSGGAAHGLEGRMGRPELESLQAEPEPIRAPAAAAAASAPAAPVSEPKPAPAAAPTAPVVEESRKKFSKKY